MVISCQVASAALADFQFCMLSLRAAGTQAKRLVGLCPELRRLWSELTEGTGYGAQGAITRARAFDARARELGYPSYLGRAQLRAQGAQARYYHAMDY